MLNLRILIAKKLQFTAYFLEKKKVFFIVIGMLKVGTDKFTNC